MLDSLRFLRPGGIAIHTTEFNVSSNDNTVADGDTVIYRKRDIEDLAREDLARLMVGRDVNLSTDRATSASSAGEVLLEVTGLTAKGDRGYTALKGFDLQLRAGEIVGIAGVSGNDQRELAETIAGLRKSSSGSVKLSGVDVTSAKPSARRAQGLGYVPEERMRDGAIGQFTVAENLILVSHSDAKFSKRCFVRRADIRNHAEGLVADYGVKTPSIDTSASAISGGNIQKMILARELNAAPKVLIVAQPTRGIDIGAAEYIHERIVDARAAGAGIVVISEDLDEVLRLSDRVVVMFDGNVQGVLDRSECTMARVGVLMVGANA